MTRLRERLAKHPDNNRQFLEVLTMVALWNGRRADTAARAD